MAPEHNDVRMRTFDDLPLLPGERSDALMAADAGPFDGDDYTYIAGPMTGYPEWNEPAFKDMAYRLRFVGIKVISPNELHTPDPDKSREWYLRRDLEAVVRHCSRVVFLRGWERSWGANLEHIVAKELGLELVYPYEFDAWYRKVADAALAPAHSAPMATCKGCGHDGCC